MPLNKTEQNIGAVITFFTLLLFSVYLIFLSLSSTIFGPNGQQVGLALLLLMLLSALCLCIFVVRKYRIENKPLVIDYLNVATQRYLLGIFMIFYGVPKLLGNFFDYQLFALDSKMADVSEFELAWYYFGKNKWLELFSGIMEFVPGVLLLNRRTYYVASLTLLPVTGQVFLLNFFFKIGGITFPAAVILLACNAYIIYSQKERIALFFRSLDFSFVENLGSTAQRLIRFSKWTGIVLAVLIILLQSRSLFLRPDKQAKYKKLVGVYTLQGMKKNNRDYSPTSNDGNYYKDLYVEKQSRWNILRRFNNQTDAFIMNLNAKDSIIISINKGGIGDDPDIIDSVTALKGIYQLTDNSLVITGVQLSDTLQLNYIKQPVKTKKWFW